MYELGLPSTLIKEIDFKHNFLFENPFNYFPLYFSLETISSVETTTIGNATYQITTTSVLGELSTPLSKTNKVLLFLTKMIGVKTSFYYLLTLDCVYMIENGERCHLNFRHLVSKPPDAVPRMKILSSIPFSLLDKVSH